MISNSTLRSIADDIADVGGVRAVVLGGSRARNTHHESSDVDLGIYYELEALDLSALRDLARRWNGDGSVEVTGPGAWGPWVDGGGWLTVDGTPVDWILRNEERVREQCDRARAGQYAFHAQPGHPLGFLDVSYAGEVATCVPLIDRTGVVRDLKASITPYPPALRQAMFDALWQADFHVQAARKGIPKSDIAYVHLCCTSALMLCAHAWHAAAGQWPTNEKGLVVDVHGLEIDTHDFTAQASAALTCPDATRENLALVADRTAAAVAVTREHLEHS